MPVQKQCVEKYTYYGVSVQQSADREYSAILLVGTYTETTLQLTVTQEVVVHILDTLVPGVEYSFLIYRLQTA